MKTLRMRNLLLVIVFLQLSACATIMNPGSQSVLIESNPPSNVVVQVSDRGRYTYQVKLPEVINVDTSSFFDLSIRLNNDCYLRSLNRVPKSIVPSYWLNITNIHGFYIDFLNGNMWKYNEKITIPLIPVNTDSGNERDCAEREQRFKSEIAASSNLLYSVGITDRRLNNTLGAGFVLWRSSGRNVGGDTDSGSGFSYLRRLDSETMINLSYLNMDNDSCATYSCSSSIFSSKDVYSFAFRRYLVPSSNLYGGVGVARINLSQVETRFSEFDFVRNNNWSDEVTALFFEMGWLSRKGVFTFTLNGKVDFAELGLVNPSLQNKAYRERDLSASGIQKRALDYRALARVTGLDFGVAFSF